MQKKRLMSKKLAYLKTSPMNILRNVASLDKLKELLNQYASSSGEKTFDELNEEFNALLTIGSQMKEEQLTNKYKEITDSYLTGYMTEKEFDKWVNNNPGIEQYVQQDKSGNIEFKDLNMEDKYYQYKDIIKPVIDKLNREFNVQNNDISTIEDEEQRKKYRKRRKSETVLAVYSQCCPVSKFLDETFNVTNKSQFWKLLKQQKFYDDFTKFCETEAVFPDGVPDDEFHNINDFDISSMEKGTYEYDNTKLKNPMAESVLNKLKKYLDLGTKVLDKKGKLNPVVLTWELHHSEFENLKDSTLTDNDELIKYYQKFMTYVRDYNDEFNGIKDDLKEALEAQQRVDNDAKKKYSREIQKLEKEKDKLNEQRATAEKDYNDKKLDKDDYLAKLRACDRHKTTIDNDIAELQKQWDSCHYTDDRQYRTIKKELDKKYHFLNKLDSSEISELLDDARSQIFASDTYNGEMLYNKMVEAYKKYKGSIFPGIFASTRFNKRTLLAQITNLMER